LQVEHLRAVGFRNAHVADQRWGLWLVTQTFVCVTLDAGKSPEQSANGPVSR
jgi:hypothetical protein